METGELLMNGPNRIPVSRPPCEADDEICRKGKPGLSDFTEQTAEIFLDWKLKRSMDEWTDEPEERRFRKILDGIQKAIDREKEDRPIKELVAMLRVALSR